jgi:hypothetical protein
MGVASLIFACAGCHQPAMGNPILVMSIHAHWDREARRYVPDPSAARQPICRACAEQLLERFKAEGLPIPPVILEPDYFERAYSEGASEEDLS